MRIVAPVAALLLGSMMFATVADATGGFRRQGLHWHKHGHVQGHHHHYFNNRIYTYNYRVYVPGPRSYYRPWYNHHLTMEYSYPYGHPSAYGYPPAYSEGPVYGGEPGRGSATAHAPSAAYSPPATYKPSAPLAPLK